MQTNSTNETSRASSAVDRALGNVDRLRKALGRAIRLPGGSEHDSEAGSPAGIEHRPDARDRPEPGTVSVTCVDYGPDRVTSVEVSDVDAWLADVSQSAAVRWIRVEGVHAYVVNRLREAFDLHTLAAEDVVQAAQRPRIEAYGDTLFATVQVLDRVGGELRSNQLSVFAQPGRVITFQEHGPDVCERVAKRLTIAGSRLRASGSDFLLYALLDTVVDLFSPILEVYSLELEGLERVVLSTPTPELLSRVQAIKHDLAAIRRVTWPTRELVHTLARRETTQISELTRTYLQDVRDHIVSVVDIVETLREMGTGLSTLYMSVMSNRMNETMKGLTIMASLFIPITFIAGVYGMNFEHMPELDESWAYPSFWGLCAIVTLGLLLFFRRRGWLGGDERE